jgi:hypothetical protein
MPWKTINRILGLAAINLTFRQQLQRDPQAALEAHGFVLEPEELEAFRMYASLPFPQFCQRLMEDFAQEKRTE